MGGVYQESYTASEKIALNWWNSLPEGYAVFAMDKNFKPVKPDEVKEFDPEHGLGWKVSAVNRPTSAVDVDIWQPKNTPKHEWRIDIHWHNDKYEGLDSKKTTAAMVKAHLIACGTFPKGKQSS